MSMIVIAALMLAQAPGAPAAQQAVAKKKSDQVCEFIDVTGSRQRQKVCHDKGMRMEFDANVANEAPNPGMIHAPPPAPRPPSFGGTPH